ncbi:unnamed protein product [Ceutorhynchus assimilis]|uniref:Uncharacterized protein n=1 Tax=Ceutorhynchus assimilis TaxID=467358 RepID=A0A9N9MIG0_9CUCU|nr:unnamed protein product [Ceutorhynchus assimilis]
MPKIFLIKNRLHQQQLRLLESQNAVQVKNDLGLDKSEVEPRVVPVSPQPLSLIVPKKDTDKIVYVISYIYCVDRLFVSPRSGQRVFRHFVGYDWFFGIEPNWLRF